MSMMEIKRINLINGLRILFLFSRKYKATKYDKSSHVGTNKELNPLTQAIRQPQGVLQLLR